MDAVFVYLTVGIFGITNAVFIQELMNNLMRVGT